MEFRRVPELDALRGIAALGIVLYHYSYPGRAFDGFFYTGAASLELFFVLSGFLITSIIVANYENRGFLGSFYARRGLRIYPIYYLLIAALLALRAFRPALFSVQGIPYYLTYTQHIQRYWFGSEPPMIYPLSHTWSLAVEEQYYLIWPILIRVVGRRGVVPLALATVAVAIASRAYGFSEQLLIGRCDGFALGALLAAMFAPVPGRTRGERARTWVFVVAGFVSLNYLTWGQWRLGFKPFSLGEASRVFDFVAASVFFFAVIGLVITHAGHRMLAPLRWRPLCALGKIGYGIYLYHLPILSYFDGPIHAAGIYDRRATIAIKLVSCVAISAVSWVVIERPILALKDRFGYGSRPFDPATRGVSRSSLPES